MLRQVAGGVLVHQSEFCQSNAVVVQGKAGVLLIDVGILGAELVCLADDIRKADQVRRRIDQDRKYVQALRDTHDVSDPRFGPTATYDWVLSMHERQLQQLALKRETEHRVTD